MPDWTTTSALGKIPTRIMCISDTLVDQHPAVLPEKLPPCDVLVHTGNMTSAGRPLEFEKLFKAVEAVRAPLKLFIAGHQDISLDEGFYLGRRRAADLEQARARLHASIWAEDMPARIRQQMTGPAAQVAGITYLEEGMHEFVLQNGATLRVYASPWTPRAMRYLGYQHHGWAFQYTPEFNRFDPPELIRPGVPFARVVSWKTKPAGPETSPKPIPTGAVVDLAMTHGPLYGHRDFDLPGKHSGCPHLLGAVERVKPKIHACGMVAEGWGAEVVRWMERPAGQTWRELTNKPPGGLLYGQVPTVIASLESGTRPTWQELDAGAACIDITPTGDRPLAPMETLCVNGSVKWRKDEARPGWLVTVDLDRAHEADATAGRAIDAE